MASLLPPLLIAALISFPPLAPSTVLEGYAPHYSKGLMERVAKKRKISGDDCYVASPILPLRYLVKVYGHNTQNTLTCTVVDVSHPKDRSRHISRRQWVELSFEHAKTICGSTKLRNRDCPITIEFYPLE